MATFYPMCSIVFIICDYILGEFAIIFKFLYFLLETGSEMSFLCKFCIRGRQLLR